MPPISDTTVVILNTTMRQFTVKSIDLSLARTYTISVTAHSPDNVALSPELIFLLELVNPCLTANFTIASSIIAAMTTYTVNFS